VLGTVLSPEDLSVNKLNQSFCAEGLYTLREEKIVNMSLRVRKGCYIKRW
jgi:hypothetical protein